MSLEIRNCPCGSDQVYLTQKANTDTYQVQCIKCRELGEEREIKENAILLWNIKVETIEDCNNCLKRKYCGSVNEVNNCKFRDVGYEDI